ncbi:MAG TPA: MBL fold metallo-hydrolase [Deinococcales bacterium]|nr:MBL fold metallo-hydrolase [Deinococcales bacterium]
MRPGSGDERSPGNRPAVHAIDLPLSTDTSGVVGAYLVPGDDGHVLVDCGPSSTLERLRDGVAAAGYSLSDVRHLLLTHIHLDHAGAAGTLARELGLTVHVHSRGAPHLARPERLMESVRRIYGDSTDALWGAFEPVAQAQMNVLDGGETVVAAGHAFGALYTPGHAVHHLAYTLGDGVFTGDVGGIRLPGSDVVVPPTPPPDIDLEAWGESIRLLRLLDAQVLFVSHYGPHTDVPAHLDRLEASLERHAAAALDALRAGEGRDGIAARLRDLARAAGGMAEGEDFARRYELASPYLMAADGLERYWRRKRPEALQG